MVSIKPQYIDEIVASMAEKLENKEFQSLFTKEASTDKVAEENPAINPAENPATVAGNEEVASNPQMSLAADFALKNLAEVADALDNNGFSVLADLVDETMTKLAKYKTHKGKDEKEPEEKHDKTKSPSK